MQLCEPHFVHATVDELTDMSDLGPTEEIVYVEFKVGRADNMKRKIERCASMFWCFSEQREVQVRCGRLGTWSGMWRAIRNPRAILPLMGRGRICQGACQRVAGFRANWMRMPPVSRGMECLVIELRKEDELGKG